MSKLFKSVLFFLIILLPMVLHAEERILCSVISDIDNDVTKLVYDMDEDQRSITHIYQDIFRNGQKIERHEMNISDLNKGGIVLSKKDKYIIARIWSDNFDLERGGVFHLDTLYSGVSRERRQYELDLVVGANGLMVTNNKVEFHQMKFIAKRSPILGPIGIERILFSN